MKTAKKVLAILLMVILTVTSVPLNMVPFAQAGSSSSIPGVSIFASATESKYNWGDDLYFDVSVTNNTDTTIENLKVTSTAKRITYFTTIDGSGSAKISSLSPGETKTVQLMYRAEKINFFVRTFILPLSAVVALFFNMVGYDEYCKTKVGLFKYQFGFDVDLDIENETDDPDDSNITISIDQDHFTTTEAMVKLSGNYSCDNLDTISYEVAPFFYETGSSNTGEVIIDGDTWESTIALKPGENIIKFSVLSMDSKKKTATVKITYDIGNTFVYSDEDISEEGNIKFINNIIGIIFEDGTSREKIDEIISSVDGEYVSVNHLLNRYWIKITKRDLDDLRAIIKDLEEKNDCILACTIDYLSDDIMLAPNDVWLGDVDANDWNDNDVDGSNWGLEAIEAQFAWNYLNRMSTVKIGVVDNGFTTNNQDLNCSVLSEKNLVDEDCDHGTHVSGTIGGTANNYRGHTGVMYDKCNLLCYDVSPEGATCDSHEIEAGIIQLVLAGAKVINMSMGYSGTHSEEFIEEQAKNASALMHVLLSKVDTNGERLYDFIIVQSAGNSSVDSINNGWFSSITEENCIHRGSVTRDDILNRIFIVAAAEQNNNGYRMCDFSSSGSTTNIAAPGRLILSTDRTKNSRYVLSPDLTLTSHEWSGTSMAAPHVAGVAGLVWAINESFTGADVKNIILDSTTATVFDNPSSPNARGNHPLVNAKLAVEEAIRRTDALGTLKLSVVDATNGNSISTFKLECIEYDGFGTSCVGKIFDSSKELQLPAGKYTFKITSDDYIQKYFEFEITANTDTSVVVMLSNQLANNQVRIVMQWGTEPNPTNPSDLDAHFYGTLTSGSKYHIYYREMGNRDLAWLDIDDIDYVGPETITLNLSEFEEFTYSIHNFTHRDATSDSEYAIELAKSEVFVKIIIGEQEVERFEVPANRKGTVWNVFRMKHDGTITKINTFEYIDPPEEVGSTIN